MLWNLIGIFFGIGTIYFALFDKTPFTDFEIIMTCLVVMIWFGGRCAFTMGDNIGEEK